MSGHLRRIRFRFVGDGEAPDVGDVLESVLRGRTRYLVHEARPTRGHPPNAGRWSLLLERLDNHVPNPAGATVFVFSWDSRRGRRRRRPPPA